MKRFTYLLFVLVALISACNTLREDPNDDPNLNTFGIIGDWYSSGENVSVYMDTVHGVDSIFAFFYSDTTYRIERFGDNKMHVFEGSFSQFKSEGDSIWSITLKEQKPNEIILQGIFIINSSERPYKLKYEVVQVSPDVGFEAPTLESGFGNTSLQDKNIERFVQMQYGSD